MWAAMGICVRVLHISAEARRINCSCRDLRDWHVELSLGRGLGWGRGGDTEDGWGKEGCGLR